MRWIDVKGPLSPQWPAAPYAVLFDDLPVKAGKGRAPPYVVTPKDPAADAERLLRRFVRQAYRRPVSTDEEVRFLPVIQGLRSAAARRGHVRRLHRRALFAGLSLSPRGSWSAR
jgi:hypothetical protein